jgi:hypothetical protein
MSALPVRSGRAGGLFLLSLTLAASVAGARDAGKAPAPFVLADVPFLSQPKALCGGAALAMVARYWGVRSLLPEDFRTALTPEGNGITPEVLESRARDLGLQTFAFRGEPDAVRQHLDRGRPLIALLDAGSGLFHYVVLLAWNGERVVFHDPTEGPFRIASARRWRERWSATGNWTLLLLPSVQSSEPWRPRFEPTLAVTAAESGDSPLHRRASEEFRRESWAQAASLAALIVARQPEDAGAWRLLATSRFLDGQPDEALEAWNAVGEPTIDLIRIDGAVRLRPKTMEEYLGLANGRLLTARGLRRAERRLAFLPAVQAGRLGFRPLAGGRASLEGALLERRPLPGLRALVLDAGVRAAAEQALGLDQAVLAPGGETIRVAAQWQPHRSRVLLAAAAPRALRLPGVVGVQVLYDEQTYHLAVEPGTPMKVRERRRRAALSVDNWWTADLMAGLEVAADEWAGGPSAITFAARAEGRLFHDHVAVAGRAAGWWSGARPFYAGGLEVRARWGTDSEHRVGVRLRLGYDIASSHAPLALWPGAGTGPGRDHLLRAHPLTRDGIVEGVAFGHGLVTGGVEVERRFATFGPCRAGLALFVDGAQVPSSDPGPGVRGTYVDVGAGVRLKLPGQRSLLRADVARTGDGGGLRVSAGWAFPW